MIFLLVQYSIFFKKSSQPVPGNRKSVTGNPEISGTQMFTQTILLKSKNEILLSPKRFRAKVEDHQGTLSRSQKKVHPIEEKKNTKRSSQEDEKRFI